MLMKKEKPIILYIITLGTPWGGAQQYVYDLATSMMDNFSVHVAIGSDNGKPHGLQKKLQKNGITVHMLSHLNRNISCINDLRAIKEIKTLCNTLSPKIIHLNSTKAGFLGTIAAKQAKSTPHIVYTAHGWVFTEDLPFWKKQLYTWIEKWATAHQDTVITLSSNDAQIAKQTLNIPKEQHLQTNLAITPKPLLTKSEARQALSNTTPPNNMWIAVIANFYPTKGHQTLIKALTHIDTTNISVFCIGEGPEKTNLSSLVKKHNLGNVVTFTDFIPNASSLLSAFDTCIIPSHKEGLPYTLLEAIAAKIPVIATNVGSIASYITNKKTGLLVSPKNDKDLSQAITFAQKYPKQMATMAQSAHAKLPSKETMITQSRERYQHLAHQ